MNRGVEIAAEVADLPALGRSPSRSRNGVAVRMAVLFLLLGIGRSISADAELRDPRAAASSTRPASARADVRRRRRRSHRRGRRRPRRRRRDRARRRRLRRRARARRPPRAPPRARPRGGRDDRDRRRAPPRSAATPRSCAMPNTEPPLDDAAVVREVLDLGARPRCATCASAGAITDGRARRGARADGRDGRARRAHLHRRRRLRAGRPADAPGARVRRRPRRHARPALRGRRRSPPAGTCTRASGRAGSASRACPAEAEELDGAARHRARPAHRRAGPLPAPVDRRLGRAGARGQGRRAAASPPRHAAPLHAHRRVLRRLRPGVQGEPAAAHRRPTSPRSRRASPTAPSTPSPPTTRPHAPEAKEQPFEEAPPGHARPRDRARRSRSPSSDLPIARGRSRCCRGSRPRSPGSPARTAARSPPGAPANLCVIDPTADVDRSTRRGSRAAAATRPYAGRKLTGRVRHTILCGRTGRHRRRGAAMSAAPRREALLVLADGTTFEGEAIGATAGRRGDAARSCSTPCCPATRRSSPTRRTPARSSRSPTRTSATTASTPTTTRAARPFCRGVDRPRPRPPPQQLARDRRPRRLPRRHGVAGIAGIDTRRLTRHIRDAGAMPGAFGTADEAALLAAAAGRAAAPTASTSSPTVTTRRAVHRRRDDAPFRVVAYDFGIKRTILRQLVAPAATVEVVPGVDDRRPTCSPASPTACSSRTAPATRRRSAYAVDDDRGPARRGAGVRHLPRPPAPRPRPRRATRSSCRSATTAATTRCATSPTGRVEITSQNHNYAVDADSLPGVARGHAREPQRRRRRGHARARRAARSACSTTPRPGPGPHDARYLFDEFIDLMAESDADAAAATTSRRSCSSAAARSSSARRASSTTRARRRAACCATRATASSSSTRTRRRS